MPRSKEEEAGFLYEQGAKAVQTGGHELNMLSGHLIMMIKGTEKYNGPLWPLRLVPPDNREIRLDRFIDYLLKPIREGLGLPSLYFLRQVLKATPGNGEQAFILVKSELAKEHVDFDKTADQNRSTELLKKKLGPTGLHMGGNFPPIAKDGTERQAARLAKRRPDLAEQVRAGTKKLSTALTEAGIRKKPKHRCPQCGYEWRGT